MASDAARHRLASPRVCVNAPLGGHPLCIHRADVYRNALVLWHYDLYSVHCALRHTDSVLTAIVIEDKHTELSLSL